MEKSYFQARNLVIKKFGRNYKHFPLVVLGLTAIIFRYKEYYDEIEKLFNNLDIFIDDDSLFNIIKKNNIKNVDFDEDDDKFHNSEYLSSHAFSFHGHNCKIVNGEYIYISDKPCIIIDSRCIPEELLNNFIHELNHLVLNIRNGYKKINDKLGMTTRIGLEIYDWYYEPIDCSIHEVFYYEALSEVVNTFETTETTESLLMLDGIIPDNDVRDFFDTLDKDTLSDDFGYECLIIELWALWNNCCFRDLIEKNIYDGNIKDIISGFEYVMGKGSFEEFADILDDYNYLVSCGGDAEKREELRKQIKFFVKKYNDLTKNLIYKK